MTLLLPWYIFYSYFLLDLKAKLLLDFCLKEIDPSIYNKAISDAQTIRHDKVDDLDGSCYQPEGTNATDI